MLAAWTAYPGGATTWLLLWGGAAGLVIAALMSARALIAEESAAPGRRAIVHWLPVAVTALLAAGMGQARLAVAIIFGTSVAALSTVTGFVTMTAPQQQVPPLAQRLWMFMPVPALLAFLLGFGGTLGAFEAVALLLQGILVMAIWRDGTRDAPPSPWNAEPAAAPRRAGPRAGIEAALSLLLAAIAAWAASRGAERMMAGSSRFPMAVMATTMLSLALVTPMVGAGLPAAAKGRAWGPITAQAGMVCLNLCVLLPAVIGVAVLRQYLVTRGDPVASTQPLEMLLYSRIAWRIDSVALVLLTLLFVPVASGKLKFDRAMAGWLIAGYALYTLVLMIYGGQM